MAHPLQPIRTRPLRERQRRLVLCRSGFELQTFACTRNGEAFVVEQGPNAQTQLNFAAPVHSLPRARLGWFELRKLRLPETQYVGGQMKQLAYFADAEVE